MRSRKDKRQPEPVLDPELAQALDKVGTARYAQATAHLFTKGGRLNPQRKSRYALM